MLLIFFLLSLIICISTIGYGIILKNLIVLDYRNNSLLGLVGLLGLFFLSVISSYTHILLPHNYIHNIFFLSLGLILFILNRSKILKNFKYLLIIFILLFICLILSKNNEDFGYYHLPNSLQFAHQKLQFGIGNLNHGFKHISSLFQIMSINYLPFFNIYLFNVTNFLFYFFLIIFLLESLLVKNLKISNTTKLITFFFLILFLVKFSRLAEFGSDLSAQISIVVYLLFCFEILLNTTLKKKDKFEYLKTAIIFLTFAVTLKFISIIYSVLLILIMYQEKKIFFEFIKYLKLNFILLIFLSLIIFIFFNFSSTGCLIYPIEKSCFANFDWSLKPDVVSYLNFHYELWSKGGSGPAHQVENQKEYLSGFNWIKNWYKLYFIGKFTDYIIVILTIILSLFLIFHGQIKYKNKNKKIKYFETKNISVYIFLIFISLIWFINFPTLRYAGYVIIFLIFIFPFSVYMGKLVNISSKQNLKRILLLLVVSYTIFLFKNINRINNELNISSTNDHNFKNFPFFWVENKNVQEILINDHKLYKVNGKCWNTKPTCIRNSNNLKVYKYLNYIFYKYE